jgi:hypothetical protein
MSGERQESLYRYLEELRLVVPNACSEIVRARIAEAVARLDPVDEGEALEFDSSDLAVADEERSG